MQYITYSGIREDLIPIDYSNHHYEFDAMQNELRIIALCMAGHTVTEHDTARLDYCTDDTVTVYAPLSYDAMIANTPKAVVDDILRNMDGNITHAMLEDLITVPPDENDWLQEYIDEFMTWRKSDAV